MAQYRDTGLVIRNIRLGEADRIVVIITREHGKIRAVAKGIRKTKSRIGSRLEPLTHVSVMCWGGRNLDIINQVEVIDNFPQLRTSLEKMSEGAAMAEVADRIFHDDSGYPEMFEMLIKAVTTLANQDSPMILPAFFWKVLAIEGVGPIIDECAHCGSPGPLVAFDLAEGGALCRTCRRGAAASSEVLSVIRRILSGGLAGVLAEPFPAEVSSEVRQLATNAMEHHLEVRLKSVRMLEKL